MGLVDKLLNQYIGRVVAFAVLPTLTAVTITVVPWLNSVLGTDLTSEQVANATGGVIVGQILLGWQWLRNRGHWEVADKVAEQVQGAYDVGVANAAVPEEPVDLIK